MTLGRFWVNVFTTGNPFFFTNLLEFSRGRDLGGGSKGVKNPPSFRKKKLAKYDTANKNDIQTILGHYNAFTTGKPIFFKNFT